MFTSLEGLTASVASSVYLSKQAAECSVVLEIRVQEQLSGQNKRGSLSAGRAQPAHEREHSINSSCNVVKQMQSVRK